MQSLSSLVVGALATLVLAGIVIAILLLIILILNKFTGRKKQLKKITTLLSENYIALTLVVSGFATMGSLSLSEVLGFAPCNLCWYQRISMYPIALISFIALIKNDLDVKKYILPMAVIGFAIAGYHILLQLFPTILECNDEVARCSAFEFAKYGFITIPVMSLTAYALVILISLFGNTKK